MKAPKEFEELKTPAEYVDSCSRNREYPSYCLDLVDEYSTLSKASKMLWEALNEVFKDTDTEEKEKNE